MIFNRIEWQGRIYVADPYILKLGFVVVVVMLNFFCCVIHLIG